MSETYFRTERTKCIRCFIYLLMIIIHVTVFNVYGEDDVKIVLVENSGIYGEYPRNHYPVLISNGKGYRIKCKTQADEQSIVRGLGLLMTPSEVLSPLSQIIVDADLSSQPILRPHSVNYEIKLFVHNGKYYMEFPAEKRSLYIPGCLGLLEALNIDTSTAINADPTPFFLDDIHEIMCVKGDSFVDVPENFTDWCIKGDLDTEEIKTVKALLTLTPQGEWSLGDKVKCTNAEEFLEDIRTLNLSGRNIKDLKPLASLTNLTTLILSNNRIDDLRSLNKLTNLHFIDLSTNQIS